MKIESKIRIILVGFGLVVILILLRTAYWQVLSGEKLAIEADDQHFYSLDLPPIRGQIKTNDGFALVSNKETYILYANLAELKDPPKDIVSKFNPILMEFNPLLATNAAEIKDLDNSMIKKLTIPNTMWVRLASGITKIAKDKIESQKISGLGFLVQTSRDYPEASSAAHLLGFVSEGKKGQEGNFGLEGFYQEELKGRPGKLLEEKDAFQRPILVGSLTKIEKIDGSELILSLDRSVQRFVEKHLQEGIATWGASGGSAIVMDPFTGNIIASASFPSFDPRNYSLFPQNSFKDPVVSELYEPGSIMKPIIMAAAINEGKLTPESTCPVCTGPRVIGEYAIHTFNNQYHPNSTMIDVLVNSDNTGMVYVGETLGFNKLYDYLQKFGFTQKTGIDLQGEQISNLRPANQWYPIDKATVTFGQGIAVNQLQMVRAISVIANGGKLVTPRLVTTIVDSLGQNKELKIKPSKEVISPLTAKVLAEMMVRVADESPEHFPKDAIPSLKKFKIAAKSGTAQIPIAGHYEQGKTIGSVVGFAPAQKPRFVVMVKLDSPTVRQWGSDTAGPVFFRIVADLLNYYNVTPTN